MLSGVRDKSTCGMCMTDLPIVQHVARNLYPTGTMAKLVAFYHGCFCSPSLSTFKKVLTLGTPLPGIDIKDINKYPSITPATAAGHLDGTRWVRARHALKTELVELGDSEGEDPPLKTTSPRRGQYVYIREQPLKTNLYHGDSTGDHSTPSRSGNTYILFMVAEDADYIHMELYQNREAKTLTKAYENGFDFFNSF